MHTFISLFMIDKTQGFGASKLCFMIDKTQGFGASKLCFNPKLHWVGGGGGGRPQRHVSACWINFAF